MIRFMYRLIRSFIKKIKIRADSPSKIIRSEITTVAFLKYPSFRPHHDAATTD